jgi:serine/threonine protein kinase
MGMQCLAGAGIVHGSLTIRSLLYVLTDGRYIVKISNYGLTQLLFPGRVPVQLSRWCSPEVLCSGAPDLCGDVWSFGITLWQLFNQGQAPFPELSDEDVAAAIKKGLRLKCTEGCDGSVFSLMQACWGDEPTLRPSFTELSANINEALLKKHAVADSAVTLECNEEGNYGSCSAKACEGNYSQHEHIALPGVVPEDAVETPEALVATAASPPSQPKTSTSSSCRNRRIRRSISSKICTIL